MQRGALCLTLSLALAFSASLGAGVAGAQSSGGDSGKLHVSTKKVKRFIKRRRWVCAWNAYVYEESKTDPGPYEVRQRTFRYCTAAEDRDGYAVVIVKRALSSRRLRVASPWLVSCELTQSSIDSWNVFAYDDEDVWEPIRSEPLDVPESTLPPPEPKPQDDLDLLSPPNGEPGGPPPVPLST